MTKESKNKNSFTYVGITPGFGKIYQKGNAQLVIYNSGLKRYWRRWDVTYRKPQTRDKTGTQTWL